VFFEVRLASDSLAAVNLNACVLAGNRALVDGGALYNRGKGLLLIQNSQFLMNEVRFDSEVHVDIVVHVYTGSSEFQAARHLSSDARK
jgi:hypothetical protein